MAYQEGQLIGNRYRIVRCLASGGQATIYLAQDTLSTNRPVSIELYEAHQDTEALLRRYAILAQLNHPHIIPIFDSGIDAYDNPYFVSRSMPDDTLAHRYPKGTIVPQAQIIAYIKQIASALQYLHDHKIIHCNVRPESMFIGSDNGILLGKFSNAIFNRDEGDATTIIGTPLYIAPEHIQGKPEPASDQYSLGVVIYEWLSGHRPFTDDSKTDFAHQLLTQPPRPLRTWNPSVSARIAASVMKALARDPRSRFANVQAFAHSLERADRIESHLNPWRAQVIDEDEPDPDLKTIYTDTDASEDPSTSITHRLIDTTLDADIDYDTPSLQTPQPRYEPSPATYSIKFVGGPLAGKTFLLQKPVTTIGRLTGNDIVIPDPKVSRYHARLAWQDGLWSIEKLSQTSTVLVNQSNVQQATLQHNMTIVLGDDTSFLFLVHAPAYPGVNLPQPTPPVSTGQSSLAQYYPATPPFPTTPQLSQVTQPYPALEAPSTPPLSRSLPAYGSQPGSASSSEAPVSIPRRSQRLPSLLQVAARAFGRFSRRGKTRQETQLSLHAVANSTLEEDDRAIVDKAYTVQAGISQQKPTSFLSCRFMSRCRTRQHHSLLR